jgi:hypothetical protein
MWDLDKFGIYYGPRFVWTTSLRADLSEYEYVELDFPAPQTWSVSQLKEQFIVNLCLILKHTLSVCMRCGLTLVQIYCGIWGP